MRAGRAGGDGHRGVGLLQLGYLRTPVAEILRTLLKAAGAKDNGRRPAIPTPPSDDWEAARLHTLEGKTYRAIAADRVKRRPDDGNDYLEAEEKRAKDGHKRVSRYISALTLNNRKRR